MWQDKLYFTLIKLLIRLSGFIACIFSIVILLALFSFNSSDISFNTASTSGEINNWMGSFGSYISDLLFQLIGLSAFFFCLILFSFGHKIASKEGIHNFALKLFLSPFCLLSFSLFFALFPEPDWWMLGSLGGVNGSFILAKFSFLPKVAIAFFSFFLSLILLSIIIEIGIKDWQYFFRYSYIITKYIIEIIGNYLTKLREHFKSHKNQLGERLTEGSPEFKSRKLFLDENEEENFEFNLNEDEEEKPKPQKVNKINKTKQIIKALKKHTNYELPHIDLLVDRSADNKDKKVSQSQIENQSKMLSKVLEDFGVYGSMIDVKLGPVVTLHEFEPAAGTKAARVVGLADDIARSMSAVATRIAVVPGKTTIGIELPNTKREMISFRDMIESEEYKYTQAELPIILGKNIGGEPVIVDLAKMPHLLIAGTTGSGKSVGVNAMILSLLYKLPPDECKFIMIDPKMLELSVYDGIPHLLSPVVTEPGRAIVALKWVVNEMEERYRAMANLNVRNISGYNEKIEKFLKNGEKISKKVQTGFDDSGKPIIEEVEIDARKLPFIVVIVDEMADLMLVAGKDIEGSIQRLAQMARAAGIHIIMATQRPSVDVITGVIKANFPTRISFQVTSRIDSRTILGTQGAEQLLGMGDMIYMSSGSKMTRVHGPFCSDTEVEDVVRFIKSQKFEDSESGTNVVFEQFEGAKNNSANLGNDMFVSSVGSGSDDDLYNQAVMIVRRDKKPSISYVQRQLRIGYNRAAILIERMEKEGIITEPSISGKREIIE